VVVSPSARALDGDLVAARVGARAVARTLLRRGPAVALQAPGEPDVAAGPADDAAVLGVVAGVVRLDGGIRDEGAAES
jgi:SOS-response transcriptional repressor LexA